MSVIVMNYSFKMFSVAIVIITVLMYIAANLSSNPLF